MSRYREPETPEQALTEAMYLVLTAPGETEGMQAVMFAASLYRDHRYDESTVELCKAAARERWEAEGEP